MDDVAKLRLLALFFIFGPMVGKASGWAPNAMVGESLIIAAICLATAIIIRRLPPTL